jgi:8-oxo-dGTP pyrophosphatase MutT (NUDIX family)
VQRETVAKVLVLNERSEALILTTGEYKAHPEKAHKPDLPGGLVESGESELIAVLRETSEEAGIVINPRDIELCYAETKVYREEGKSVTKLMYLAKLALTPTVTISWEHEAYEWAKFETILEAYEFRPFYRDAIRYIQNNQLV